MMQSEKKQERMFRLIWMNLSDIAMTGADILIYGGKIAGNNVWCNGLP